MDAQLTNTALKSDSLIRKRLREELKQWGQSIEEVAERTGIAKGTLDNILTGRTESMKDVHLQALANAYPSLDLRYLLTGVRPAPSLTDEVPTVYITRSGDVKIEIQE